MTSRASGGGDVPLASATATSVRSPLMIMPTLKRLGGNVHLSQRLPRSKRGRPHPSPPPGGFQVGSVFQVLARSENSTASTPKV
jgi:hypothetical protein